MQVGLVRRADDADDQLQLMDVILPGEQRLPPQELREDAPHGPHVNRTRVLVARQQKLRSSVPPRHHILRHELPLVTPRPRQPEIADLQVTARVQQQVAGFQIAVQHVG